MFDHFYNAILYFFLCSLVAGLQEHNQHSKRAGVRGVGSPSSVYSPIITQGVEGKARVKKVSINLGGSV